ARARSPPRFALFPLHDALPICTQHALAVIVHVQPPLATAGAERWPIAIRITDAPLVRGVVGDLFSDESAAFLSGRTQSKKASFRLGRRESILAHETRSSVLAD